MTVANVWMTGAIAVTTAPKTCANTCTTSNSGLNARARGIMIERSSATIPMIGARAFNRLSTAGSNAEISGPTMATMLCASD